MAWLTSKWRRGKAPLVVVAIAGTLGSLVCCLLVFLHKLVFVDDLAATRCRPSG